jgi:hypothetical protein
MRINNPVRGTVHSTWGVYLPPVGLIVADPAGAAVAEPRLLSADVAKLWLLRDTPAQLLVCSFVVHSIARQFAESFICSFIRSFFRSFLRLFDCFVRLREGNV